MQSTGIIPTTTPGKRLIACVLLPNAGVDRTLSIAEALSRFTPNLAQRRSEGADNALFLDLTKSLSLFKEEWLPLKIEAVLLRFSPQTFHLGFAQDPGTALTLACTSFQKSRVQLPSGERNVSDYPLKVLENFVFPFLSSVDRDSDEKRILQHFIATLEKLGVQNLRDILQIPASHFSSRFHRDIHHWVHRIRAALEGQPNPLFEESWPPLSFPETLEERYAIACEDPTTLSSCSGMDTLLFCIKTLSDRIFSRLRARGLRLGGCEIRIELETGKMIPLTLDLPVPQGSSTGLLPILRDRLTYEWSHSTKESALDAPISTVFLRVTETTPAQLNQRNFFSEEDQVSEAWESFLGRILPRIGKEHVFLAKPQERFLPEASWSKITDELLFQELTRPVRKKGDENECHPQEIRAERPTLLLKEPAPLQVKNSLLSCSSRKESWRILSASFAEKISGEWWDERGGFSREYYQIQASPLSGNSAAVKLWVFLTPNQEVFLHGYFD